MAGANKSNFAEKLTPYLRQKLQEYSEKFGENSEEFIAFSKQYIKTDEENILSNDERLRHYQSEVHVHYEGKQLRGVERLYRRTILLEPTMVCAAHCRWCLRGQYPQFSLNENEIENFAKYAGSEEVKEELKEILITGGDPLMAPKLLEIVFSKIKKFAPNIQIIRIGTRLPVQDPKRVNEEMIQILKTAYPIKLEIGTNINHPSELTIESKSAYEKLYNVVFKIYDQSVLLKGVNDNLDTLGRLYDEFRYLGIESHYLFHCIPMRGMSHHRTSVMKGLEITKKLINSGLVSGRAKPMFTLMTDLGKITLLDGTLLEKNDKNEILIQSNYTKEDFLLRNPSWEMPESAIVDKNGFLRVWYPDGNDDPSNSQTTPDMDNYFSIPINRITPNF